MDQRRSKENYYLDIADVTAVRKTLSNQLSTFPTHFSTSGFPLSFQLFLRFLQIFPNPQSRFSLLAGPLRH